VIACLGILWRFLGRIIGSSTGTAEQGDHGDQQFAMGDIHFILRKISGKR